MTQPKDDKQQKAYKFRLYPNQKQQTLINQTFGCVRFTYNHFLTVRMDTYEQEKRTVGYQTCSEQLTKLKEETDWLRVVDKFALQNSIRDLDVAYKKFFAKPVKSFSPKRIAKAKRKGRNLTAMDLDGYPKYKSKRDNHQSYRTNMTNGNIEIKDNKIKLPKLGWVKFAKTRKVEGEIVNVTVSRNPSGKYFVSVCFVYTSCPYLPTKKEVGLDMGIKTFATLSNGDVIENPKFYRKYEERLAFLQRALARKKEGSSNYRKLQKQIAMLHEKIKNCRHDFLHKESTKLVRENQVIALEDLNVKGMLRNHKLAKSIADASWSTFKTMLTYKAKWYGRELRFVNTFFPSSQRCHCCGFQNTEVRKLSVREWQCDNCGEVHDRDVNASLNILQHAI